MNDLHDVNLLRAVAVFILHGAGVQSAGVRYPAINAFVRTFQQSDDPAVRRSCVQTAASIFELADHSTAIAFVQVGLDDVSNGQLANEKIVPYMWAAQKSSALKKRSGVVMTACRRRRA